MLNSGHSQKSLPNSKINFLMFSRMPAWSCGSVCFSGKLKKRMVNPAFHAQRTGLRLEDIDAILELNDEIKLMHIFSRPPINPKSRISPLRFKIPFAILIRTAAFEPGLGFQSRDNTLCLTLLNPQF